MNRYLTSQSFDDAKALFGSKTRTYTGGDPFAPTGLPLMNFYDFAKVKYLHACSNETWKWNGSAFVKQLGASPSARLAHAMAKYGGSVTLFGGFGDTGYLQDTWERTGLAWMQKTPLTVPSSRCFHAMAQDTVGSVVMFGGLSSTGALLGDTYVWDGTNWTRYDPSPAPSARMGHAMAYHNGTVVLFGGYTASGPSDETWTWNGSTHDWSLQNPTQKPSARRWHCMAYDTSRNKTVLFGGRGLEFGASYASNLSGLVNREVWEWNGTNWSNKTYSGSCPDSHMFGALLYDAINAKIVSFGGASLSFSYRYDMSTSDVKTWNGTAWTAVASAAYNPCQRHMHAMAGDIMFGGSVPAAYSIYNSDAVATERRDILNSGFYTATYTQCVTTGSDSAWWYDAKYAIRNDPGTANVEMTDWTADHQNAVIRLKVPSGYYFQTYVSLENFAWWDANKYRFHNDVAVRGENYTDSLDSSPNIGINGQISNFTGRYVVPMFEESKDFWYHNELDRWNEIVPSRLSVLIGKGNPKSRIKGFEYESERYYTKQYTKQPETGWLAKTADKSNPNTTASTSGSVLTDTSKAWATGAWVGYLLRCNSVNYPIVSNTATSITVQGVLGTHSNQPYIILKRFATNYRNIYDDDVRFNRFSMDADADVQIVDMYNDVNLETQRAMQEFVTDEQNGFPAINDYTTSYDYKLSDPPVASTANTLFCDRNSRAQYTSSLYFYYYNEYMSQRLEYIGQKMAGLAFVNSHCTSTWFHAYGMGQNISNVWNDGRLVYFENIGSSVSYNAVSDSSWLEVVPGQYNSVDSNFCPPTTIRYTKEILDVMPIGSRAGVVRFLNQSGGGYLAAYIVNVTNHEPSADIISVTPYRGVVSCGKQSGPFSITSETYTLTNNTSSNQEWVLSGLPAWLIASKNTGILAQNSSDSVTISLSAGDLTPEAYNGTITFSSGAWSVTRIFSLVVETANIQVTPKDTGRYFKGGGWVISGSPYVYAGHWASLSIANMVAGIRLIMGMGSAILTYYNSAAGTSHPYYSAAVAYDEMQPYYEFIQYGENYVLPKGEGKGGCATVFYGKDYYKNDIPYTVFILCRIYDGGTTFPDNTYMFVGAVVDDDLGTYNITVRAPDGSPVVVSCDPFGKVTLA
jgi:hypothetical protein